MEFTELERATYKKATRKPLGILWLFIAYVPLMAAYYFLVDFYGLHRVEIDFPVFVFLMFLVGTFDANRRQRDLLVRLGALQPELVDQASTVESR